MKVFENGMVCEEALNYLKRIVVDPNMVDQCKKSLDASLYGIMNDTKQKFENIQDRTFKAKGEDVFNDVGNMLALFFPNNSNQVSNVRLKSCYKLLHEAINYYNEIRKDNDPNSIYKSYMIISSEEISGMGTNYKEDYNVARFAFIKELLEEVFKYSLVAWGNRRNTKSCWRLLENVLNKEDNILLFCSDVYALDVAFQKQKGKVEHIRAVNECTLKLVLAIKGMVGAAMEICKELSEDCMLRGDEAINALFNLYSIDEKTFNKYKKLI